MNSLVHLICCTTWFLCVEKLSYPETDVCMRPCCFLEEAAAWSDFHPHTHSHNIPRPQQRVSWWSEGGLSSSNGYGKQGSVGYPCSELGQMWPPRWTRCVWPRPFMFFTAIRHRWLPDLFFNSQQWFGVTSHVSTVQYGQGSHSGHTEDFPLYWKLDCQQKTVYAAYSCVV